MTTLPNSCTVFVRVMSQLNNVCALQSFLAHRPIATLIKIPFIKVFFVQLLPASLARSTFESDSRFANNIYLYTNDIRKRKGGGYVFIGLCIV